MTWWRRSFLQSNCRTQLAWPKLTVEHVIEQGEETGTIAEEHAQMLRSVLEFKNTVAREIMVPRTQVVAFDVDTSIDEVLAHVIESGHSRYPVYRAQIDQVEGILNAKDLFQVLRNTSDASSILFGECASKAGLLRSGEPENRRAASRDATSSIHLAVVVDEFGGAAGIVTLEDIIEEIVGEIRTSTMKKRRWSTNAHRATTSSTRAFRSTTWKSSLAK